MNGYLIAAEYSFSKKDTFNTWNFAPPLINQITVINLAKLIFSKFGKKNSIIFKNGQKFHESKKLNLSSKKASKILNWRTVLSKKNIINFTYDWYLGYIKKMDMKNFSIIQLKNFYKLAKK